MVKENKDEIKTENRVKLARQEEPFTQYIVAGFISIVI